MVNKDGTFSKDIFYMKMEKGVARIHVSIRYNPRTDHIGIYGYNFMDRSKVRELDPYKYDQSKIARVAAIRRHKERLP